MTPSQTAVIFALGSASRIGATIGTTTTAISIKSRKNPRIKITAITTINCDQKPPGNPCRKSRTYSSPPNPRNAAVSIVAPSRMINTMEVVFAVSIITSFRVFPSLNVRHVDQPIEMTSVVEAITARNTGTYA